MQEIIISIILRDKVSYFFGLHKYLLVGLLAIGYWLFLGRLLAMGYWRWDFKERIILPIELISTSNISRISLDMYPRSNEISN